MPKNKAYGPDGSSAEFYKHFWEAITPLFIGMKAEITITSKIPPSMNIAMISLLLKPGKHPNNPVYCPLSLIDTDIKIVSKALASRIERVIPFLVHTNQKGFVKGRQSSINTQITKKLRSIFSDPYFSLHVMI